MKCEFEFGGAHDATAVYVLDDRKPLAAVVYILCDEHATMIEPTLRYAGRLLVDSELAR
jgi:hypothetical protein